MAGGFVLVEDEFASFRLFSVLKGHRRSPNMARNVCLCHLSEQKCSVLTPPPPNPPINVWKARGKVWAYVVQGTTSRIPWTPKEGGSNHGRHMFGIFGA